MNALGFAARKGRCETIECEVIKPDGIEEAEPLMDFMQDAAGNLMLLRRQFQLGEEAMCRSDSQRCRLADIDRGLACAQSHSARFCTQPLALALRAGRIAAILAQHHPDMQLVFLAFHERKEAMHAGKASVTIEDEGLIARLHLQPWNVDRNIVQPGNALQFSLVGRVLRPRPRIDGALSERFRLVRDDEVQIEIDRVAKTLAAWTGAERIVEREQAWLRFTVDPMTVIAFVLATVSYALARLSVVIAGYNFEDNLTTLAIANFYCVDDARAVLRRHSDAIHQHVDRVCIRAAEVDFN